MEIDERIIRVGTAPGHDSRALQRMRDRGELIRLRPGVYLPTPAWSEADATARFALRTQALVAAHPGTVLAHRSAALAHGLPLAGPLPDRPEAVLPDGERSRSTPAVLRRALRAAVEPVRIGDALVMPLERTVVELAALQPFRFALAPVDAALRRGIEAVALLDELDRVRPHAHLRARTALTWGDGRAESGGESVTRGTVLELGFPPPDLQVPVLGRPWRSDLGWLRHRLRAEFDGLRKYRDPAYRGGRTAEEVVIAEKRREDAIRALTGDAVVRWTWDEVLRVHPLRTSLLRAGLPVGRWRALPRDLG